MISAIFGGTLCVTICLSFIFLCSSLTSHNSLFFAHALSVVTINLYLVGTALLLKKKKYLYVAWMLIIIYIIIATIILFRGGINTPIGVLLLGLVIIISSVMLGVRLILPTTLGVVLILYALQVLDSLSLIHPSRSSATLNADVGDVATSGTALALFALISWLSARQMEESLKKALTAEAALEKEKALLSVRLEERTRLLREAQLEEMRQLYRFAELGQLTAVILHDLANNLSVLTLDIEDLQQRHRRSPQIIHAKESIEYLERVILHVRRQLKENTKPRRFDAVKTLKKTAATFIKKGAKLGITIHYLPPTESSFYIYGDPLRLSQTITILINNAIEASLGTTRSSPPTVTLRLLIKQNKLYISVIDKGIGIPTDKRDQLFTPLHSTKKSGLGIGLFITKQVIETHFKGSIYLNPKTDLTEFTIELHRNQ